MVLPSSTVIEASVVRPPTRARSVVFPGCLAMIVGSPLVARLTTLESLSDHSALLVKIFPSISNTQNARISPAFMLTIAGETKSVWSESTSASATFCAFGSASSSRRFCSSKRFFRSAALAASSDADASVCCCACAGGCVCCAPWTGARRGIASALTSSPLAQKIFVCAGRRVDCMVLSGKASDNPSIARAHRPYERGHCTSCRKHYRHVL